MNWQTIVPIILGSSILSAVLTKIIDRMVANREKSKYNNFVALTLAHDLEEYSWKCANELSDHKNWKGSEGFTGKLIAYPPDSFQIPKENYKNFDTSILDRVFAFPLLIRSARSLIQFWDDVTGQDDASDAAYIETTKLGSLALTLSGDIRKKYKLAKREIEFGKTTLKQFYDKEIEE